MNTIIVVLNTVLSWIGSIPDWFFTLVKDLVATLFDMLGDLFAFVLDQLFQGIIAIIALIPVPTTTFNANQYLAGAPSEFIGMLIAIRIPEAFGIIVVALGIRFLLGLIPVIRVGG